MLDLKYVLCAELGSLREWGAGAVDAPQGFGKGVAMGLPGPEVEQYMEHRWLGGEGSCSFSLMGVMFLVHF